MKFSAILLLPMMVIASLASGGPEELNQAVADLLRSYSSYSEEKWEHVPRPPEHILSAAMALHDGSIGIGSDDFEIVVIRERELDLYRVIWIYIWVQTDCGDYHFRTENHLLTGSGEKSNARVFPEVRASGTLCLG